MIAVRLLALLAAVDALVTTKHASLRPLRPRPASRYAPPTMSLAAGVAKQSFNLCAAVLVFRSVNTPPFIEKTVLGAAAGLALVAFKPAAAADLASAAKASSPRAGAWRLAVRCRTALHVAGLGLMALADSVFGGAAVVYAGNVAARLLRAGANRHDEDGAPAPEDDDDEATDLFLLGASVLAATSPVTGQFYKLNGGLAIAGMLMTVADRAPKALGEQLDALSAAAEEKRAEAEAKQAAKDGSA